MTDMTNTDKSTLDPQSRDYFDIRLYSVMARSAATAGDDLLGKIFYSLMRTLGGEYKCGGAEAINEGEEYVKKILDFCKMRNLMMEKKHIQQYATWILGEHVQNSDFSNIINLQNRQLEKGVKGVTREGVDNANKLIFEAMSKYKEMPTIGNFLKEAK